MKIYSSKKESHILQRRRKIHTQEEHVALGLLVNTSPQNCIPVVVCILHLYPIRKSQWLKFLEKKMKYTCCVRREEETNYRDEAQLDIAYIWTVHCTVPLYM
jgi:hypothetical protein